MLPRLRSRPGLPAANNRLRNIAWEVAKVAIALGVLYLLQHT